MEHSGVLLYPKPCGISSQAVVDNVKQTLGGVGKVGHAGTLDLLATGLVLVLVGRATKAQQLLMNLTKTYRVTARLGWISDTQDREGTLTYTGRVPANPALPEGLIFQRPPQHSAVKVQGERLYKRARRGETTQAEPRPVTVHRSQTLWRRGELICVEIECSAGTYVRSLIAGLEDAYCESLERTRIGPFRLSDADPHRIIPLHTALEFLPERRLFDSEVKKAANGASVSASSVENGAPVRLTYGGKVVAIAEGQREVLRPRVVFGL
jgi:tRNA pseudouridine55 synthase